MQGPSPWATNVFKVYNAIVHILNLLTVGITNWCFDFECALILKKIRNVLLDKIKEKIEWILCKKPSNQQTRRPPGTSV